MLNSRGPGPLAGPHMGESMRRLAAAIIALSALANPSAWTAAAATGTQRVIIKFKAATPPATREAVLGALKAKAVSEILSTDQQKRFVAVVAELPPGAPSEAAPAQPADLRVLAAQAGPSVMTIEPDRELKWIDSALPSFQANPLPAGGLRELGLAKFAPGAVGAAMAKPAARDEITWGLYRLHVPAAWDYTEGTGVRVAVIDTGILSSHPDLGGKVDGGYNAITDLECARAEDCAKDDNGHGTHVSGTIAARRDGRGVVGVAPKARLYAVKVLSADGSGSLSSVVKGIVWAANNGMHVANMSLGSPFPSEAMEEALAYARAMGVVVVAAAGNSGGAVGYPGAYDSVIAVSAADWNDKITDFSSRGEQVKFIAPGDGVVSTWLDDEYQNLRGTSMAAPHVTGLAALVVSQGYRGLDGPDGVLAQLVKAARPLDPSRARGTRSNEDGYGMVDAGRLVRSAPLGLASLSGR